MQRKVHAFSALTATAVAMLFAACASFVAPHVSAANSAVSKPDCTTTAPLGELTLLLRGSLNGWGAAEEYAFVWACDAYYLNVDLLGRQEFKIADAGWTPAHTYGTPAGKPGNISAEPLALANDADPERTGNLAFRFDGTHTLRLAFPADGSRPQITVGPQSFANPTVKAVDNVVALSAKFDSRNLADKTPFGATTPGAPIAFSFSAQRGIESATLVIESRKLEGNQEVLEYNEIARLAMTAASDDDKKDRKAADQQQHQRWRATWTPEKIGVYGYRIEFKVRNDTNTYMLHNNNAPLYWTRERGAGGPGVVAYLPEKNTAIRRFRQTVYDASFAVPDWAQDAVYYYIFPDRFRNGDRSNDPKPGVTRFHDGTVEFHAQWIDEPYRPGDGSDRHVNNDFFGGDIAGIIEKLDDIADLGANTLYMTPLLRGSSNHKYDAADYRTIDPGFGGNEDFTRLIEQAAKRGMRLMKDASFNHTGRDSIYFDRFGNFDGSGAFYGGKINPKSPYADWYSFDAAQTEMERQYRGWAGVADLPETNKASQKFRDFAYNNDDSITRLWLRQGAAGWRMDVAPWVPDEFWREWRKVVKAEKPDALTITETWFDASKHLLGDTFDSSMNYIFRNAVLDFAGGTDARRVWPTMEHLREAYPPQAFHAMMNLLSSHDQARSLHVLGWHGTQPPAQPNAAANAEYAIAKRRYLLAVTMQMTWPGAPAIYYGEEVGLGGGDEPLNRLAYPWADQGGTPDLDLRNAVRTLTHLRRDHPVLSRGNVGAPLHIDHDTVAVLRSLERNGTRSDALVAWNNQDSARSITFATPLAEGTRLRGLLNAEDSIVGKEGRVSFSIPALSGVVLSTDRP
jgi:cyclomaltodextrinase / maltogenic alpha-amylase / neopullulanase